MRIQPRRHLLEILPAVLASSLSPEGEWVWGGRDGSDSISDAEQLLCLMLPATELPGFRLDVPDQSDAEVLGAVEALGDALEVPRRLVRISVDYLKRYTLDDGETPSFAGGRFTPVNPSEAGEVTAEQLGLDVVESYALSLTLTISMLGFSRILRRSLTRAELIGELDELDELAGARLTAAMVGLLRSFCITVWPVESGAAGQMLRMVNQSGATRRRLVEGLHRALRENAAGLRDLNVGNVPVSGLDDDDDDKLFECGWSWGPVVNAPTIDFGPPVAQREGYALAAPYLYFTAVALDGIADLFSERTRILGLLSDDQQRLAGALRLRWDLTQQYWATLTTFGVGRWPIEDIPWRTVDGLESEYLSLLVTSIVVRGLGYLRDADEDLTRIASLLAELGVRGRVTRRPMEDDPALRMHHPGFALELEGAGAFGPRLAWFANDYAPLLLKRTLQVARLINDIQSRDGLLTLADEIWRHALTRRIGTGPGRGLWDQPAQRFPSLPTFDEPSWHHTFRVVESLVTMTGLVETEPLRSEPLVAHARDLLAEAEHLYAQALLGSSALWPVLAQRLVPLGQQLERARGFLGERPAQATAVVIGVLQELYSLATARSDG